MNKVEDFINATKLNDLLNKKEDLINMTKLNELLNKKEAEEKKNLFSRLVDTMAGIVMPMIGPLAKPAEKKEEE